MSVGKIALGVFLGNLAFAILASIIIAFVMEDMRQKALSASVGASYEQLKAEHPELANRYDADLHNTQ